MLGCGEGGGGFVFLPFFFEDSTKDLIFFKKNLTYTHTIARRSDSKL
eukprot:COSAG02_NODE_36038_length_460_cov_0.390582_1_plen_47_part_00